MSLIDGNRPANLTTFSTPNLALRSLKVHRDPGRGTYRSWTILRSGDEIPPLARSELS
jgi:hypothetical protein